MGSKLDELMAKVNKDVKDSVFVTGIPQYEYQRIPFTSPRMNYITHGGLPLGRLVEFYGEEGGGKTTSALDQIANFQQLYPDRDVLYVDAENTLDIEWARKIGVDVDAIKLYQPQTESAEYILQVIKEATLSGEVGMWVLDSIPCLTSESDMEKDLTDAQKVAGVSGILTRFSREIVGPLAKTSCMGIGINQLRDKVGSQIPGQTSTPGGRAWRHFCTNRIKFMKGSYQDEAGKTLSRSSGEPNSQRILVNMEKTKSCRPNHHVGFYTINYDTGIDYLADLVDIAVQFGIIDKHGAWFTIIDSETGEVLKDKIQGQANVATALDEDDELMERVETLVNDKIQNS